MAINPTHRHLIEIGLGVAEQYGFALAGAYAVQAHRLVDRPSMDVDLFTDSLDPANFANAVSSVADAFRDAGFVVEVRRQVDTFAHLVARDSADEYVVEFAADWRANPPVRMEFGPVLHRDDAVANKMSALHSRAALRDFIDIVGVLDSGHYTQEQLLELADHSDPGFERHWFAEQLHALRQYADDDFAPYGLSPPEIAHVRERIAAWSDQLG